MFTLGFQYEFPVVLMFTLGFQHEFPVQQETCAENRE
jgi:hypothetical protein